METNSEMSQDKQYLKQNKEQQQLQYQQEEQQKEQKKEQAGKILYKGKLSADFSFQFDEADTGGGKSKTILSEELNAAFMMSRSKEYMDILKKQVISAMSDEEIKRIIAREIVRGGAKGIEDVISLPVFMTSGSPEAEEEAVSAEEQALMQEMSDEDVADFLEMLNASFAETIAKEEMKLKEALMELDKQAIDQSFILAQCPIRPSHDIHILPKNGRLYFCHLVNKQLSPVFEEAKRLLYSGEAAMVHVYKGCAFVIDSSGKVTKRIDVVEEPMELVIRNGWEELP